MSDGERERRYYAVAVESKRLIKAGDSLKAMYHILDELAILPDPRSSYDSTVMGVLMLRVAFVDFFKEPTFTLSALYYQEAYQYLKYLPDTLEIDALRFTSLALVQNGDTTAALPYLYRSLHLARWIGDPLREAKADTCLSYLAPREIARTPPKPIPLTPLFAAILVVWLASILGARRVILSHLGAGPKKQAQ